MIRKARMEDPETVAEIINRYAAKMLMLPRPLTEVYEHLRDFIVCEEEGEIVGCVALHISWKDMAEIRSLAVCEDKQNTGIGTALVEACLDEADKLGVGRVFVLTYEPSFFEQFGFRKYPKDNLPHKIWSDCVRCPHFPNCDEEALLLDF